MLYTQLNGPGEGGGMKTKMVSYIMDLHNPPPLTPGQKAELRALKGRPIDYSDIPQMDENSWKNPIRNPCYWRPTKTSTTVRIDSDVLAWLRAQGKGYQSRINALLRREMLASLKSAMKNSAAPAAPARKSTKAKSAAPNSRALKSKAAPKSSSRKTSTARSA
jgi:uncharacterized protein (DUF4415 family)